MTPAEADKLIRDKSFVRLTDKYGDSEIYQLVRRSGRIIYTSNDEAFDRTDIASFEIVQK